MFPLSQRLQQVHPGSHFTYGCYTLILAQRRKVNNGTLEVGVALHTFQDLIVLSIGGKDIMKGFTTAGGKKVEINAKALANARKLLEDSDNEEIFTGETGLKQPNCDKAWDTDEKKEQDSEKFVGFRSGTGKKVAISEEALQKAQKMMQISPVQSQFPHFEGFPPTSDAQFPTDRKENAPFPFEFTSASLTSDAFSNPSASKPTSPPKPASIPAGFQLGFSTGRAKPIPVSEAALQRAKLLFADDKSDSDKEEIVRNSGFAVGFVSGNGKSVAVSEGSLQRAKALFCDSPVSSAAISSQTPSAMKSNSSTCSIKFLPKAPAKATKQPLPSTLKRSRPYTMLFTTPKPVTGKQMLEPTTKRVTHQKAVEKVALKPDMRTFLGCKVLELKGKFGKYGHIRPLMFEESQELVQIRNNLEREGGDCIGKSVEKAWLSAQLRLILWKYVSYSQLFPGFDSLLSEQHITQELTRRYAKETLEGHRGTISRLLDRDALPGSRMVLLIGLITYETELLRVELSDGWQSVYAFISESDSIGQLLLQRKLKSGSKVELCNSILEGTTIKMSLNSLRLARWDARLGLSPYQVPFRVSIQSILQDSGTISSIEGYIIKRYPVKFYLPSHKKTYSQQALEDMEVGRDVQVRLSCLVRLRDALPGAISECCVTLERLGMDQWEAMKDGMCIRCMGLEISRFKPSHNGVLHLITHIHRLIPRKKIAVDTYPQSQCSENTNPDSECYILGCLLHINSSPSQEILRLHLLTTNNTVAEVKVHSHPFFGSKLTRLRGIYEKQEMFVLFTNCTRDFEPAGTGLAVSTSDESEIFTYLQGKYKAEIEVLKAFTAVQTHRSRFRVHQEQCGRGRCICSSLSIANSRE